MKPPVLVLHVPGTNRDREVARACALAGGDPEIVHLATLAAQPARLDAYRMLVLPGGFSYGDHLGAGKIWALLLRTTLSVPFAAFVASGRPVLGICNGFQALVKSGWLPGFGPPDATTPPRQLVTLSHNDSGRFECRWVDLVPEPASPCVFTRGLDAPISCPVAHAEGKLITSPVLLRELEAEHRVPLRYAPSADDPAGYPGNPNGSAHHIAALTNASGTILGLMPHPEDHVDPLQHPQRHRGPTRGLALPLFTAGVAYASRA